MSYYYGDTDPWAEIEAEEDERAWKRQDADREQAEMERQGNAIAAAERRGICTHGSVVGYLPPGRQCYPEQAGLKPGQLRCTKGTGGCTAVFDSDEDWAAAIHRAVPGL